MPALEMAAQARLAAEVYPVTYVDFLTIVLTALGVMLTALAIGIGVAAIWGYQGIKDGATKAVMERAEKRLEERLQAYPEPRRVIELFETMQALHEQQKRLSTQLVTSERAKTVDPAGKKDEDAKTPRRPLAKKYPGKG